MRKEARTKRKHDMDASKNSEVLLKEWLEKAKQGEDYVAKQNVKKRSAKKVKQPNALASSNSSESEGTGETRRRNEMVDETEEDSATKEATESKEKSTTVGSKGEYSYSEDTYFDADDDDVGNVEIDHDNINLNITNIIIIVIISLRLGTLGKVLHKRNLDRAPM
ncbi:hypothetical protein Dimus_018447 [Dionaea muscipula]